MDECQSKRSRYSDINAIQEELDAVSSKFDASFELSTDEYYESLDNTSEGNFFLFYYIYIRMNIISNAKMINANN